MPRDGAVPGSSHCASAQAHVFTAGIPVRTFPGRAESFPWASDCIEAKTNEYAGLLGGAAFEPQEENPMIGFRGACRYYDSRYREGFALECRAMRKVREEMGLQNVKLMVPFCRTVEEGRRVIAELASNGLVQGERGLEVYVMCEIPSNVILAKEFAEVFDERNEAVTRTIAHVITAAHAAGRKIGICGQAPSDYLEFARFLVTNGIDSLSLNPDSQLKTMLEIAGLEQVPAPIAERPKGLS